VTDWSRVPVLVGAGQHTNREEDPLAAPDPFALMTLVARQAASGVPGVTPDKVLAGLTHLYMVHSLSLRHGDPARELARRLGAETAEARTSGMGGNIPQWLVDRAAELVLSGGRPVVLLAGAEALATRRRAKRQDVKLPWPGDGGWPRTWPELESDMGVHPVERASGLEQATAMYALIDSASAHASGRSPDAQRAATGRLMAGLNAVAADNPHSWFPTRRSAEEITTVTPDNRVIFHPYPKYVNAVMDVDMAAAVLLTDAATARQWGLGPDEVVYLRGWADATEIWHLSARDGVHRAEALAAAGRAALGMAGVGVADVDGFDLYSCFPSSVEAAARALGLAEDDPRPLTLTGGLPYHGGPGSNYVTHAIANAFGWLRDGKGTHALVHGNGYYLTKHAVGLYSAQAPSDVPAPDTTLQERLDAEARPLAVEASLPGPAEVVAYTVPFERDGTPGTGIVVAESGRRRTVARADAALTARLLASDAVGTEVRLGAGEGGPDLATAAG
jgi:acetyl-CoA C-acetyltransferase